jgi:hypothetical protein
MGDVDSNATAGVEVGGYRRGASSTDRWDQYVIPVRDRIESYAGRAATFRIPGIAGTTGQKLVSIFNAAGSSVLVDVETIAVDVYQTAARVVEPPALRLHRVTTLPTGGTALPKVAVDTGSSASSASVTLLQGASAEKTSSAITSTLAAADLISQEPVARALTLVGYEQFDRIEFINDQRPMVLRAGQGLVLNLDYTVATSNPVTDMYLCSVRWSEYTRP